MTDHKPPAMTPTTRAVLVRAIATGITIETACEIAGVHRTTFHRWTRGTRPVEREFQRAVEKARVEAEAARPEPLTEDEHRSLVAEACRRNSVQAMKLAWVMILADRQSENEETEAADNPLAKFDQLAEARARRQ